METVENRALTPYELTYGRPLPNFIQAALQANLIGELRLRCAARYRVVAAVAGAATPAGITPDLALYPAAPLDYTSRALPPVPPVACLDIAAFQPIGAMVKRVQAYFQFGVRSCWVIQPAVQGVFVFEDPKRYAFFHADDVLRDATLGLELPLGPVFA